MTTLCVSGNTIVKVKRITWLSRERPKKNLQKIKAKRGHRNIFLPDITKTCIRVFVQIRFREE